MTSATTPSIGAATEEGQRTLGAVRALRDEFVDFVSALCRIESPSDRPETQSGVHALLAPAFAELGYDVRIIEGRRSGNHLLAVPKRRRRGDPVQLMIGHSDTVWPLGTLEEMPVEVRDGRLHGPGSLDMKGGLTCALFALRTLRDLGLEPEIAPVVFVNADEEVGSPDSTKHVRRLARVARRAFVLEPALGAEGLVKTARKGLGHVDITIEGRAAHAGLDPEAGASAIVELSHVIQELNALNDPENGTTVNVGRIDGGTRANVVAAEATAAVDIRVTTMERGREVERRIHAIRPIVPGVKIRVEGGVDIPPLERTPRNVALWETALQCGIELGLELDHGRAGGGSDGNRTSLFTATLDGLGCVGDGAHAVHEHIEIDRSLERCALLARLLMAPERASTAP